MTVHRIRRQRWTVKAATQDQAFEARKILTDRWEDTFLPAFGKAFDERETGATAFRIPRLELSLKVASLDELTTVLPGLILELVRKQFASAGQEFPFQDAERVSKTPARRRTFPQKTGMPGILEPEPRIVLTQDEDWLEVLVQYLKTGDLRWDRRSLDRVSLLKILTDALKRNPEVVFDHVVNASPSAMFAICFRALQLSFDDWPVHAESIVSTVSPLRRDAVAAAIRLLATPADAQHSLYIRLRLAAALLVEALKSPEDESVFEMAAVIVRVATSQATEHPSQKALQDFAALASASSLAEVAKALHTVSPSLPGREAGSPEGSAGHVLDRRPALPDARIDSESREFSMSVSHAGLILLHPYLTRFFENLHIKTRGEDGLSPQALPRAAALLHFLATGREEIYEFELGLIKILLGLRPESPLPVCEGLLTGPDREECAGLLAAVVEHWSILKNTSVAGLRASFLERRGYLLEEDWAWRLQVESQPFDMLLNQLPWAISTVRLPWVTKPIYTEWPTL